VQKDHVFQKNNERIAQNLQHITSQLRDFERTEQEIADVCEYVGSKHTQTTGLNETDCARLYWEQYLANESRIKIPQHKECEFAILVPVYNEHWDRIKRQIDSLKRQVDVSEHAWEVIYVVNNGLNAEPEILRQNKIVVDALKNLSIKNIHVIDKSTLGNEIPRCNVGRARNRALGEASIRFFENGKNGYLIHTDADTYFEDVHYFSKLKKLLMSAPGGIIGLAGGFIYEFSPDIQDAIEIDQLQKKAYRLTLIKKWIALDSFRRGVAHFTEGHYKSFFAGAHMISRSFESSVIGGIYGNNVLEDVVFGLELQNYAEKKGLHVITVKDQLFLTTALRESDRTDVSLGVEFDEIVLSKPFLIPNPLTHETPQQFRERVLNLLTSPRFEISAMRNLLSDSKGKLVIDERRLVEIFETAKYCLTSNLSATEIDFIIEALFNTRYPKVVLNEETYQALANIVSGNSTNGEELVHFIDKITNRVRLIKN
jgi:hypothetical protein